MPDYAHYRRQSQRVVRPPVPEDKAQLDALALSYLCLGVLALLPLLVLVPVTVVVGLLAGPLPLQGLVGVLVVLSMLVAAGSGLLLASAYGLYRCRFLLFSQVLAVLLCFGPPVGTLLGVLTLVVLARPTVRARYG